MIKEISKIVQNNGTVREQQSINKKLTTSSTITKTDVVSISPEAKRIYKENISLSQNILSGQKINRDPLFRQDKVDKAKERLNTSFYDNKIDETIDSLLLDLFA